MAMATDAAEGRALVLTGPRRVSVQPRARLPPKPGEALVRIAAVGVCATDVELYDGTMGYFEAGLSTWPFVPGHEWAGTIVALGEGAPPHLAVGKRVIGEHITGCRWKEPRPHDAEPPPAPPAIARSKPARRGEPPTLRVGWASCPICARPGGEGRCPRRDETGFFGRDGAFQTELIYPARQLLVLPDSVPFHLAALAEPLATVQKAVRLAGLDELRALGGGRPPRVVVIGDGPVGLLAVQVLCWKQARVACLVGASSSRLARGRELGAESTWNVAGSQCEEGLCKALEEGGQLPSLAIEAAGHPSAVPLSLRVVEPGGRVVLLGLSGNKLSEVRPDDIVLRQLSVRGSLSSEPEDWESTARMIAEDALQSVVTHTLTGLEKYEEAIDMVRRPAEGQLKVQLMLGGEASDPQQGKRLRVS